MRVAGCGFGLPEGAYRGLGRIRRGLFSLGVLDHRALTKVDLGFLARGAFQAGDRLGLTLPDLCGKALHGLVGVSKFKTVAEFAVKALSTQARLQAVCDEGFVVAAEAFARTFRFFEAGFSLGGPAVTSVVQFEEESQTGFGFWLA